MADPIKIEGLAEFRRNLKKLDSDLPKALRVAFNQAADIVVNDARPLIPSKTGKAKASVKARSSQTLTRVSGGGNKAPYYPWLDFGGHVGKSRSVRRPFLKEGRYIYNAYFKNRDSGRFQEALSESLIDVARLAGVEVD
jgi:hypothetical protein